jgi:hypothetical protein
MIGAMRYAFVVATWVFPWMRGTLPPRHWRKIVAATQGVVLVFAAADVLPRPQLAAALAASLALLIESFGRDVGWLWQHRLVQPGQHHGVDHRHRLDRKPSRGGRLRLTVTRRPLPRRTRPGIAHKAAGRAPAVPRSGHPVLPGRRRGSARDHG